MSTKNNPAESTADREILITRDIDAPREMVWQAMIDPKQIVHWWGPRGFTTTIQQMDVRPGGAWNLIMHGPDGTDYPNHSLFTEVTPPARLVFLHGGAKPGGPEADFEGIWTFDALDDSKTRVTIRMIFPTAAKRDLVVKVYGAIEGGHQTLARLSELTARTLNAPLATADRDFVISRVLSAPREKVWAAWTDSKQLAQWWGPRGFINIDCQVDLRVGGVFRTTMRSLEDGAEFPLRAIIREFVPLERLVLVMDCSDHPEAWHDLVNPARDKSVKPHLEMLQTVTFEEVAGKTKLTIRSTFESPTIRDNMVKVGMNEGWSSSLDRLVDLLDQTP
jgi:uncharacterized protein YndB with AHSA1/START domain